jgi:hypothetical protein
MVTWKFEEIGFFSGFFGRLFYQEFEIFRKFEEILLVW